MSTKPVLLLVGDEREYDPLRAALARSFTICQPDATGVIPAFDIALIDAAASVKLSPSLREVSPNAPLFLCGEDGSASGAFDGFVEKPMEADQIRNRLLQALQPASPADTLNPLNLIDSLPGGIGVFDLSNDGLQVAYYNDALRTLSGYPSDQYDAILRNEYHRLILPEDLPVIRELMVDFRRIPRMLSASFRLRRMDGSVRWLKVTCAPTTDAQNRLLCNAIFIDVTRDKENERRTEQTLAELKYATEHDALTGVFNRETFYAKTREMLNATPTESYVLLAMDIERFKVVNDLYGKEMGDRVLRAIGAGLAELLCDVGTYGRLEADHFAACFPTRYLHTDQMTALCEQSLRQHGIDCHIDISFGIYRIHNLDVPIEKMCDRAVMALKTTKGSIVKQYAYYDDVLRRDMLEEQSILNEMNAALAEGQFVPYIQPIYSVETRKLVSAEALVRWRHPRKGLISPAKFVPLFERNGFIATLDASMRSQTIELISQWNAEGRSLPVSINVSRIDLYHPHFCEELLASVREHGVSPSQLRLEITESAYSDNPDELSRVITELRSHGFQILMDDFGSGYSSLNVLMDMPVDVLKIDMRFLSELDDNPRAASILTSVTRMAKWLSIPVIAEGVETENQLSFLRSIGCDSAQGFLLGKPIPSEQFARLLNETSPAVRTPLSGDNIDLTLLWDSSAPSNLMFNGMIGGMALCELAGDVLEVRRVNDGYYELFGCTPKQVFHESRDALRLVHPDDQGTLLATLHSASESGRVESARIRHRHSDGRMLWLETRARYLCTVGQNEVFYCTFNDITAQRELEQTVEMNRYLGVLQTAFPLILEYDCGKQTLRPVYSDGRIQLPPPRSSGLYEREDLAQLVHPDDIREFLRAFDQEYLDSVTGNNGSYTSEQRLLGENGDYGWTSRTILHLYPHSALYLVCFSDIDARKRNDALSEQNRMLRLKQDELMRYQALMEQTGSSMLEWNMDDNTVIHSKGYANYAISQYPLAEIWSGKHHAEAFDVKDDTPFPAFRASLLKHGTGSITVRMRRAAGEPIWCRLVCAIIKGRHAARLIAAITQVDELVKTRESYISSQTQFQSFADNFMVGLGVVEFVDDDVRLVYLSNGYQKMLGYSDAEFPRFREDFYCNVYPDDREPLRTHIDETHRTGKPFALEYRAYHASGKLLYLRAQARMLQPMENVAPRLLTVVTDVTELKTLQNHLQSLLDGVPAGLGIYELTNPPRARYINKRMAEIFGYSYDELCNLHQEKSVNLLETDARKLDEVKAKALQEPLLLDGLYRTRKKDDSPIWVRARSSVVESTPGVITCYTLLIDETREHDAELKLHWQEEGYRLLAEHTGATTFDYDVEADIMTLMFRPFGEPPYQSVMHGHIASIERSSILKPEFISPYRKQLLAAAAHVGEKTYEFLADFNREGYRWYRAYYTSIADDSGAVYRVIGRLLDITGERAAKESLLLEQTYRKALLSETLCMFDVDYQAETTTLLHLSEEGGCRFFPLDRYCRKGAAQSSYFHPEDVEAVRPLLSWDTLRQQAKERQEIRRQFRALDVNRQWVWLEAAYSPMTGTTRALLSVKVVDSERKREEELRARAELDPVSGLLNRCTMQDRIETLLHEHTGEKHAFLLMDIDGFKTINDTFGHATGDLVIRVMAQAIRGVFTNVLGRLGGDEFVALLAGIGDVEVVENKAREIIGLVDALRFPEQGIQLTLSIGIAIAPTDGSSFDTLYRNADEALYRAKAQGKHGYRLHGDDAQ